MMSIRNAAKAILLHQGKILLNKNQNSIGDMCYGMQNGTIYYDLPGGGQNPYETLEEAVVRECMEEAGIPITIDRLAAIFEEISMNEAFRSAYSDYAHKVHFVFIAHPAGEAQVPTAEKDLDMVGSEWVDLAEVKDMPLFPKALRNNLYRIIQADSILYLGVDRY